MQSTQSQRTTADAIPTEAQGDTKECLNISRIILVGAGGVGGFIAQHLGLLVGCSNLLIIDGDTFERTNTARQGFAKDNLGMFKAEATADYIDSLGALECSSINEFITEDNWDSILTDFQPTLLISAVDNDKARKLIFSKKEELPILWGANELWTPQAGVSLPQKPWSPLEAFQAAEAAGTACGIQTVHANACAASMAMQLLSLHASEHEQWDKLPLFISKASNEPLFQMFANEI